jgi:dienelactone hydrolase
MKALIVACLAALPALVSLPFCGDDINRRPIEEVGCETVTYQAEDGVGISAGWCAPEGVENPPIVMLFHERDGSWRQWEPLIGPLVDEGYAVLAPDLRGHGQSDPYELTNSAELLRDVNAALIWLDSRDDIDFGRVAVVGARLGAELAYVSTGLFSPVIAGVAMSPSYYKEDDPLITSIRAYAAHDVFVMAGSSRNWEEAVTLGILIQDPGGRRYVGHEDKEGVALLVVDDVIRDIRDWLKKHFEAPTPTAPPPGSATPSSPG